MSMTDREIVRSKNTGGDPVKIWITKYALTSGITTAVAEVSNGMATVEANGRSSFRTHYHGQGSEWHMTENEANKRAEDMRRKKIEALQKQIAKLEQLKFKK